MILEPWHRHRSSDCVEAIQVHKVPPLVGRRVAKHLDRVAPHERSDNGLPRAGITLGGPMPKDSTGDTCYFCNRRKGSRFCLKCSPVDAQGKVDLEGYDACEALAATASPPNM
ncbi:hypothetical protein PGTUg99_000270 [Puccinia graminis f. sp. tritici]|uniref:Uncharacterized protein n=1 Tax=Puccinia graminis f. sp. tritici TaxID=56615 RepID=A0A5B0RHV8_PUCGR|nr:hypothetical protein PGTUg99_000270 [Puccinia graminis f. sp. tritici]